VILVTFIGLPASAADYHVDCRAGNDDGDGRSPASAWRGLAKASATTFAPGDSILLKRGTRCSGTLWPKGSGEPGRPIRLAAYGEGPLPTVDAAGGEAAVKLFNQQYWHIETIEATGGNPYGIHISGDRGTLRHFRVRNVVIHDVGGEVKAKTSGLLVVAAGGGGQTFEDVVIDGVTAHDTTQWAGILVNGAVWGDNKVRARDVTIRNSIVHDVYGDGIVLSQVEDGLIEKSAAWRTGDSSHGRRSALPRASGPGAAAAARSSGLRASSSTHQGWTEGSALRFDHNLYWHAGSREPEWSYGGREHVGFPPSVATAVKTPRVSSPIRS
jgi:hypothetical protein